MRKYLYCENGFVEKPQWMPNCWVNVECPDQSDFEFLTKELKVPEAFLEDQLFQQLRAVPACGKIYSAADHFHHGGRATETIWHRRERA